MRRLAILAALVAALWGGFVRAFPDRTHSYRFTLEADTPNGPRGGSGFVEVVRKDFGWLPMAPARYEFRVRGEAAFVDLGGGRNVVAVLAHGDSIEWVDRVITLWVEAHDLYQWDEGAWSGRRDLRGAVELRPPLIPTLVSFADPLDPATVRVVHPNGFDEAFGPGFRFRRATLEVVPSSWWPASALGLSPAEPVADDPIERRLPWLAWMETNLAGTSFTSSNDIRERLSPRRFKRQDP